ncbi:MAG TPA: DsrE family protein [Acidobacteriaceae bacterium]|nr:DsrE family protein [Acidobacteriaceae bacterium]
MPVRRVLILLALFASLADLPPASAQNPPLPVPGYPAVVSVPGAHNAPDPGKTYKVVFDIGHKSDAPDQPLPGLLMVAKYVNTLAQYGVPASHRDIAVVFHQEAVASTVDNDTWKAAHNGADNPSIALIQALAKAGVALHVCGQGVARGHIDPKTIQPEIEVDVWALTTLIDLQQQGYIRVGD